MCTHLDKTGSTYYFRRPVPKDLIGQFSTATGQPRKEWKFSLRTKDREEAKRLKRPHEEETDKLIDEARAGLDVSSPPLVDAVTSEREREERSAAEVLAAESSARRSARTDQRALWRQRRQTSTAMLTPEEAAAVDLIKEGDAEREQLRASLAVLQAGNERLGLPRLPSMFGSGMAQALVDIPLTLHQQQPALRHVARLRAEADTPGRRLAWRRRKGLIEQRTQAYEQLIRDAAKGIYDKPMRLEGVS